MSKDMDKEYGNEHQIDFRTKLALKVLMLMVRVIAPYRFEHQFDKHMNEISKMIDEIKS